MQKILLINYETTCMFIRLLCILLANRSANLSNNFEHCFLLKRLYFETIYLNYSILILSELFYSLAATDPVHSQNEPLSLFG